MLHLSTQVTIVYVVFLSNWLLT